MDETTAGSFQYKGYRYLASSLVIAPMDSSLITANKQQMYTFWLPSCDLRHKMLPLRILVVFLRVECVEDFVPSCFISEALLINVLGTKH